VAADVADQVNVSTDAACTWRSSSRIARLSSGVPCGHLSSWRGAAAPASTAQRCSLGQHLHPAGSGGFVPPPAPRNPLASRPKPPRLWPRRPAGTPCPGHPGRQRLRRSCRRFALAITGSSRTFRRHRAGDQRSAAGDGQHAAAPRSKRRGRTRRRVPLCTPLRRQCACTGNAAGRIGGNR